MTDHPFHRWVAAAEPKAQLWRTLLGFVLINVLWLAWTVVLVLMAVGGGVVAPEQLSEDARFMPFGEAAILTGVTLIAAWGFWIGGWIVLKLFHGRGLASVTGAITLKQFGIGAGVAVAYLGATLGYAVASGHAPVRTDVDVGQWVMALLPLVGLILVQATGEELVFRGYLPQQLATRWRHPLVWGLLPAVAFGLAHVSWGEPLDAMGIYYLAGATMLGLVMMAMVWRTGSLAAAMGFHVANNVGAVLVIDTTGAGAPVSLFAWTPDQAMASASVDLLAMGLLLAFVLSPLAPLPKGQALRRKDTRAAP
jgi:membrane protease YdiL (CAAX protease family)